MGKNKVTPRGVMVYPCLTKPDTKFDAAGRYKVGLRLPAEVAQPLVDEIDAAIDAKVEEVKASGKVKGKVKRVDPSYSVDEETGDVTFNFKMKASGKRQDGTTFTQKPTLKKHDLTDIGTDVRIWGGSEGKVAFELCPFYTGGLGAGVSLRLKGVQVLKLVTGGGDCGFEKEDGEDFDGDSAGADSDSDGFTAGDNDDDTSDSDGEGTSGADF